MPEPIGSSTKTGKNTFGRGFYYLVIAALAIVAAFAYFTFRHVSFADRQATDAAIDRFIAGLVNILVLATIAIQAYIYRRQWAAMIEQRSIMQQQLDAAHDQLDHQREVFEVTERPIVFLDRAEAKPFQHDVPMNHWLEITNRGRTAATNVRLLINMGILDFENSEYARLEEPPLSIPILPPDKTFAVAGSEVNEVTITREDYSLIAAGMVDFAIFGYGDYEDLTGRKYEIEPFVFRFYPSGGFMPAYSIAEKLKRALERSDATPPRETN
jgi:hypothetical protein